MSTSPICSQLAFFRMAVEDYVCVCVCGSICMKLEEYLGASIEGELLNS